MNKQLLGTLALLGVTLSLVFVTSIVGNHWSLTSLVINSQTKHDEISLFDEEQLFGFIQAVNSEIGKVSAGEDIPVESDVLETTQVTASNADQDIEIAREVSNTDLSISPISGLKSVLENSKIVAPSEVPEVSEVPNSSISLEKKVDQEKLKQLLIKRKNFMVMLAKADAQLFLLAKLPEDTLKRIPAELKTEIEGQVTMTGKIEVIQHDDFEHEENNFLEYHLLVKRDRISFYPTHDLLMQSGTSLQITGSKIDGVLVANNKNISVLSSPTSTLVPPPTNPFIPRDPPPASPPLPSVGEQKVLVLLINFQDSGPIPATQQQVSDRIFNGSFQNFFQEQSYGMVHFTGDVYDWITLPRNCNDDQINWPESPFGNNEISIIIQNNHIDLDQYDRLVLLMNCGGGTGYSTLGKTTVSIGDQEYQMSVAHAGLTDNVWNASLGHPFVFDYFDYVLSHEMGHSLGVRHANAWECGSTVLRGNCNHIEYGNLFDTMGTGSFGLHFNAFYKDRLGWVPAQNKIIITESGRYIINAFEDPVLNNSPKKFAEIEALTPIYLEYRKALGFDAYLGDANFLSNQNGLMVNQVINFGLSQFSSPRYLDMQPQNPSGDLIVDLQRSTLDPRNRFSDPATGVKISPVATSDTSITFDVSIEPPVCVPGSPLLTVYNPPPFILGEEQTFYFAYGNGNSISCGPSVFSVEHTLPESWMPTNPSRPVLISPTETGFIENDGFISFTAPSGTRVGTYIFEVSVVDSQSNRRTTKKIKIQIVNPPVIRQVIPNSGQAGSQIVLVGRGFGVAPYIVIWGPNGFAFIDAVLNGSTAVFNFPRKLEAYDGSGRVATEPGMYQLNLSSGSGYSNTVNFEVLP